MAMENYGAADASLTVNGINISNFGDTDPPITIDVDADYSVHKDGIGGNALRLDRVNQPVTMSVALLPGSDEAAQLTALEKTKATVFATFRQVGTNEKIVMFDGIITRNGPRGRAGRGSVTDEVFNFRFNNSERN